ncbi:MULTISPECIES: type I 3-dehydroquinate dehydratase [unclassified Gilliamella]|uniref:type I 3-dehydroquinate dehydratase n=1 Tax=unclassified Gilliamella TaxID=2685620 RepID=UPI00226995B1|nr:MULTISPECIES: type I 3-dehydroquinate dehydratase [unclassified Gilliamella]MCX8656651.1 type I 3-dehydroquinate dehydratase [Gilliamella sp. B2894]MCX8665247.1 type I 3-dehydroquinate dehydratase [Gilliamella sp. B2887]MCX8694271.1 type I 3-dehydroquinate dehydratase [Gilliamella sp. B2881]MCX8696574.1 type I 3-dehydroquinate dehydratase [Gilliamella sp. B2828]MCX8699377.1 type I 3-dehydroquinate dehydratase [Gilliamella sp. B3000]
MKTVTIKGIEIGSGAPKIIVPVVGKTEAELLEEILFLQSIDFDVLEWRVDHFTQVDNINAVKQIAKQIRELLPNKPILFTFRTENEGGVKPWPLTSYMELNKQIAHSGLIDLIDVEVFIGDNYVKEIIHIAHQHNVFVVASNHDFDKTPPKSDIIYRLRKMQDLGADISKIAVMPQTTDDVLTLLAATTEMNEKYAEKPIITMSMSGLGVVSRVAGTIFGSSMTFGAAKNASAPGQLDVQELRYILEVLYRSKI